MNSTIFDIAKELFFKKGYFKTKISDITDRLGLVPANFYRYYNSKEEILVKIIRTEISKYCVLLLKANDKKSFNEKIKLLIKGNLQLAFEEPYLLKLILDIQNSTHKFKKSTLDTVYKISTITNTSIEESLAKSNLDLFAKKTASEMLINTFNIFTQNLIRNSQNNLCPEKILAMDFKQESHRLLNLVKGICYGLKISSNIFSKLDPLTKVFSKDYFLNTLNLSYNSLSSKGNSLDILYVNIFGINPSIDVFFIPSILIDTGNFLKNSFRDSDKIGRIDEYSFAILLSEHSSALHINFLNRKNSFEIFLKEKYKKIETLKIEFKILTIKEGYNIDFNTFFMSPETVDKYIYKKRTAL